MSREHLSRRRVVLFVVLVMMGIGLSARYVYRNRLSSTTILGQWNGYYLQGEGAIGQSTPIKVPLTMTFRPDGLVSRGYGRSDANYLLHDHVLIFYNIHSKNAPSCPVVWDASIVGSTFTIGEGKYAAILSRAR